MAVAAHTGRTYRAAIADLRTGWPQRELWGHLGWQDIRQRYRRSVLGPDLDLHHHGRHRDRPGDPLRGAVRQTNLSVQLPYVLVGLIIWGFISGCISEGSEVFIANVGLITHLPAPLSVHVYRLVWRQVLFFLHNLVVYVIMLLVFPQHLHWSDLSAFPAFGLLVVNGAWVALLLGIVTTRFRDLAPIVTVSWSSWRSSSRRSCGSTRTLLNSPNPASPSGPAWPSSTRSCTSWRSSAGRCWAQPQELRYWVVVLVITVLGWALTLFVLRRYRSRVARTGCDRVP